MVEEESHMIETIKSAIIYFGVFMLFLTATVLKKKSSEDEGIEGTNESSDEHDAFIVTKKDPKLVYSTRSVDILFSFNSDVHLCIASYLHANDIISLSVSCITLYEELSSELIWEQLWIQRYSKIWKDFEDVRLLRNIHWDPAANWGAPQSGWFIFYLEFEYCWANWLFAGCNNKELCYAVLFGEVYNVTKFVPQHPGSSETLLEQCGGDATQTFIDISHSRVATQLSKKYRVSVATYIAPHEDTNQIISLVVNHQKSSNVTSDKVGSVIAKKMVMETYESTIQAMHEYAARASLQSKELFDQMDKSIMSPSTSLADQKDANKNVHASSYANNMLELLTIISSFCLNLLIAAFKTGNDLMFVIDEDEDEHSFVDIIEGIDSVTELYETTKAKLERNQGRDARTPEPGHDGPVEKPKQKYSTPKKKPVNLAIFNSSINMRQHAIYCLEVEKLAILNYLSNNIKNCKKVNRNQQKIINISGHASCLAAGAAEVAADIRQFENNNMMDMNNANPNVHPMDDFIVNEEGIPVPVIPGAAPPPEHLRVTNGNNLLRFLGYEGVHCGQPRLFYDPLAQEWTVWWSCCALGEVIHHDIIQEEIEKLPIISSSSKRLSIYMKNVYSSYMKRFMHGDNSESDWESSYTSGSRSHSETSSRNRSRSSSLSDNVMYHEDAVQNPVSWVHMDPPSEDISALNDNRNAYSPGTSNTSSRRNSHSTGFHSLHTLGRMLDNSNGNDSDELDEDEMVFVELLSEVAITRDEDSPESI